MKDYTTIFIKTLNYIAAMTLMIFSIILIIQILSFIVVALGFPAYYSNLVFMGLLITIGSFIVAYFDTKLEESNHNEFQKASESYDKTS